MWFTYKFQILFDIESLWIFVESQNRTPMQLSDSQGKRISYIRAQKRIKLSDSASQVHLDTQKICVGNKIVRKEAMTKSAREQTRKRMKKQKTLKYKKNVVPAVYLFRKQKRETRDSNGKRNSFFSLELFSLKSDARKKWLHCGTCAIKKPFHKFTFRIFSFLFARATHRRAWIG